MSFELGDLIGVGNQLVPITFPQVHDDYVTLAVEVRGVLVQDDAVAGGWIRMCHVCLV